MRHLTFDVGYDRESTVETKVSGLDGGPASGTAANAGPIERRRGTVTVDVVAATADGGLAVDISEDNAAPVRVGITDTALLYDRSRDVTDEELALLHYLARGFVKADTLSEGTAWTETTDDPGMSGQITYTVASVDVAAETIAVRIEGSSTGSGLKPFIETSSGTMTYDTGKVVPIRFDISTRTVVTDGGRRVTAVAHVSSTLKGDSLSKKVAPPSQ